MPTYPSLLWSPEDQNARLNDAVAYANLLPQAPYPGDALEAPYGLLTPATAVKIVEGDANRYPVDAQGNELKWITRPANAPIYYDPTIDGVRFAMPGFLDLFGNATGSPLGMVPAGAMAAAKAGRVPGLISASGAADDAAKAAGKVVPREASRTETDMAGAANPRAVIGGNNPPPAFAMPPRAPVTPEGLAVKGKDYTKAQQQTLRELSNEAPGTGPIDLTQPPRIHAPQQAMERYQPPRGISPRMQRALENEDVLAGVRDSIARGQEMGADKWYHNDAIRQSFVDQLGPEAGAAEFKKFMDYAAATSPRSDVSTNIRNASYYYMMDGQELPASLPYPYGHVAQNLHRQNAAVVQGGGFDIFKNPKPASFSENLQGNLVPVTVDTHAFRNIGIRTRDPEFLETSISVPYKQGKAVEKLDDEERQLLTMADRFGEISPDGKKVIFRPRKLLAEGRLTMDEAVKMPSFWASKPNANEYAAAEELYARLGREAGLAPADAQAAGWAGAGDVTGLKSPATKTFPQLFNERVEYTARMRGEDPQETLRLFITKQKPLLSIAPVGGVASGLLADPQDQ